MKSKRRRKFPWWVLIVIAIIVLVVNAAIPRPFAVKTVPVTEGVLTLNLSSTGVVEGELSDISPRVTARIVKLYAQEGNHVRKGQTLVQLEDSDLLAAVDSARAAAAAADRDVEAAEDSAKADSGQLSAAVDRARASLNAARHNLRDLEAGSRSEDIAAQRAVLAQTKANAIDAKQKYQRAEALFKGGAISAQERDSAKASNDAAQAAVDSAQQQLNRLIAGPRKETVDASRAQVREAEAALREAQASMHRASASKRQVQAARARAVEAQAALANAQSQLSFTTITSPVTGIVARKHKEVGETSMPLDPIYTVSALDKIWVTAEVDEEDAAAVALGQKVDITLDAYPGRKISGSVIMVSRIAEPKDVGRVRAKIVRAKIRIDDKSITLRPGMEVDINGSIPTGGRMLLVPNDAVMHDGDKDIVYVIRGKKAHRVEVRVGQSNFDFTQILSGLKNSDRVAVTELDKLSDGIEVKVVK
ncbi:efflux RND transporter periplasmic adaptor subunit [bacterium]|nr:efflux RND transporter periplasmic adaptor subunit [bacterium]